MSGEATFRVRLALILIAFFRLPFLLVVVPLALSLAHDANVAALDGLAEKIIGAHDDFGVLSGQIVGMVWLNAGREVRQVVAADLDPVDRKSTRLNSSHSQISYAVFCLKKKNIII